MYESHYKWTSFGNITDLCTASQAAVVCFEVTVRPTRGDNGGDPEQEAGPSS